ncbi:MAG: hypothetical protein HKN08_06115 [Gammaproteobacteria bacterium]|nr:hypothetical protein [Gammaproteobacteria bacterium]
MKTNINKTLNQADKNFRHGALASELKKQCERNLDYDLSALTSKLQALYRDTISLIALYGSCLRTNKFTDSVLDFYIVVNNYKDAYNSTFYPVFNRILAPNVFYIETTSGSDTFRAKYAVISEADFYRGIHEWFHSYIWARFAQPVRLIYARDKQAKSLFYTCVSHAVVRYLNETAPTLGNSKVTTEQLWTNALMLSYASELRPEPEGRSNKIVKESLDDLDKVTVAALPALDSIHSIHDSAEYELSFNDSVSKQYQRYWQIRRWQGKLLSILRLV